MAAAGDGTLLVVQSGGPTPVINASLTGVILEAQQHRCFTHIYGARHSVEGLLHEDFVDLSDTPEALLETLVHTPAAALGSSRYNVQPADLIRIAAALRAHGIRYLAYIGGNGSMLITHRLAELLPELRVMGVPKTVDNDLALTDHAPGFGSAARFLALAARDIGRDLEAMTTFDDVILLEAIGRDAGWLAAAAALLKTHPDDAPHLVYVPEASVDAARLLDDVQRVHDRLKRVFVVVGEGIRDSAGEIFGQDDAPRDALGRPIYSLATGASVHMARLIHQRLGLLARSIRPNIMARAFSACISEVDRREALLVGQMAVRHLAAGQHDHMVTLQRPAAAPYQTQTGLAPLAEVTATTKPLPRAFLQADPTQVAPAFFDYALPLIGESPLTLARLSGVPVPRLLDKDE